MESKINNPTFFKERRTFYTFHSTEHGNRTQCLSLSQKKREGWRNEAERGKERQQNMINGKLSIVHDLCELFKRS